MRYINTRVRLCLSLLLLSVPGLAAAETIELVREHGVFMVPVRINDAVTIPFILDSGAGDVSVPEDVFKTLLRTRTVTESDSREPGVYVTADGSEHMRRRFILHEVRVGDHVVKDVMASVAPDKADPLLGQSFLGTLPRWAIDNTLHTLVFGSDAPSPPVQSIPPAPVVAPQQRTPATGPNMASPTTIPFPLFGNRNPPPGSASARWFDTKNRRLPPIDTGDSLNAACRGYGYDGPDQRAPGQCRNYIAKTLAGKPGCVVPNPELAGETVIRFVQVHPEAEKWSARQVIEKNFCQ
jgi:clan AA aspartic protease (TIGR02281 family)